MPSANMSSPTPSTPVKWINYIGTLDFGGFVDHTGGALICKERPGAQPHHQIHLSRCPPQISKVKRSICASTRRRATHVFSPIFCAHARPLDRFECRVGLGYTRFVSELFSGVRTEVTDLCAPGGSRAEIRDIRITNFSANAADSWMPSRWWNTPTPTRSSSSPTPIGCRRPCKARRQREDGKHGAGAVPVHEPRYRRSITSLPTCRLLL